MLEKKQLKPKSFSISVFTPKRTYECVMEVVTVNTFLFVKVVWSGILRRWKIYRGTNFSAMCYVHRHMIPMRYCRMSTSTPSNNLHTFRFGMYLLSSNFSCIFRLIPTALSHLQYFVFVVTSSAFVLYMRNVH